MPEPQPLRTAEDYRPALLRLMGQLERATASEAVAKFGQEFGALIPAEHRQKNPSGGIRWHKFVYWARQGLVAVGLMGSGGRGVWTITSAGRQWLTEHPDGGGEELKARIRAAQRREGGGSAHTPRKSRRARRSRARGAVDQDRPIGFTVAGHRFRLSGRQVLEQARRALASGISAAAQDYRKWIVEVDGQPVGAKWLFSLATGLSVDQFNVAQARAVFRRLGIEVRDLQAVASPRAAEVAGTAAPGGELTRREFLDQVADALKIHLPDPSNTVTLRSRDSYLQIAYPEFRISQLHYEVYLTHSRHEVALHLESKLETNLMWLEHFKPEIARFSQSLGHPVQAERWGRRYARVTIPFPAKPLTAALAQEMGSLMARFIQATYPIVQKALAVAPSTSRVGRRRTQQPDNAERRYHLLDTETCAICDFLDGHSGSRPSDERLCYWVYLCLTFELHDEGWRLFALIDPSQVSKTLYERTRRFAQTCRVRTEVQA